MRFLTSFLRRIRPRPDPDPVTERRLADALDGSLKRSSAVSTETSAQWMRLNRAVDSLEAVPARRAPRLLLRYSLAASALAVVLAAVYLLRSGGPASERFATGRGEQLHVLLPDSSQVILSHTTSISFDRPSFLRSRMVTLEGEAFFIVRHTGVPFVVSTDAASAAVLGTQFNMMTREGGFEVGVNEGSVSVTSAAQTGDTTVLLRAGDLLTGAHGAGPGVRSLGEAGAYPGWRHGRLFAERASLASICREIGDRFDVTVEVRRRAEQTVSGIIVGGDAASMVATLARLIDCTYRYDGGTYILY